MDLNPLEGSDSGRAASAHIPLHLGLSQPFASGSLVALMLPTPYPATLKRHPPSTLIQTVGRGLFKPQHPRQEAHTQELRPSLASPSAQGQHHLLFCSWSQHPECFLCAPPILRFRSFHLGLPATQGMGPTLSPHFTGQRTEAQRCYVTCLLEVELCPPPRYAEVLTLSTSECDPVWKQSDCRCN